MVSLLRSLLRTVLLWLRLLADFTPLPSWQGHSRTFHWRGAPRRTGRLLWQLSVPENHRPTATAARSQQGEVWSRSVYRAFVDPRFKTNKRLFLGAQGSSVWCSTRQASHFREQPRHAGHEVCTAAPGRQLTHTPFLLPREMESGRGSSLWH